MNAIQLYGRYAATSIRSQLQYRASFLMQSFGAFVVTGIEFLGLWALFDRFGSIKGWRLPEVALLYGMISITWSVCDAVARGFDQFGQTVKSGDFDRILLRPRSTVLQLLGQEFTLRRVGRLAQGGVVFGYAFVSLDIDWNLKRWLLLAATIFCGACMFFGLVVVQATSAFWTTESLEIWNAFTYGGVTASQYPLGIYRPWFRRFFTYVIPLACVNYFPGIAIIGRTDPLGTSAAWQWCAPLAGPLFLLVSLQFWQFGVRHYTSTGS